MNTIASSLKAKLVRVAIEADESGLYFATSPDLLGLLVAKTSVAELRKHIPIEIQRLFLASDVEVAVSELDEDADDRQPGSWVAVPRAAAEQSLAALSP